MSERLRRWLPLAILAVGALGAWGLAQGRPEPTGPAADLATFLSPPISFLNPSVWPSSSSRIVPSSMFIAIIYAQAFGSGSLR